MRKSTGEKVKRAVSEGPTGAAAKPRRERVLREAARQLNDQGLTLTALHDLADRLGVSRAALYYYVKDRADLVFQTYQWSLESTIRRITRSFAPGVPVAEGLKTYIGRWIADPDADPSYISEIGYLRPDQRQVVLEAYERAVGLLREVFEAALAAGDLRPCDVDVAARTVMNMASFTPFARRWALARTEVSRERLIAAMTDLLLDGWSADRSRRAVYTSADLSPLAPPALSPFDRLGLGEAKREAILATASRLFNERGVSTTSLDDIAGEMGFTKRAIYHHVGDKPAVIAACYMRAFRIYAHVRASAAAEHDPLAALCAYQDGVAAVQMDDHLKPLRLLDGVEGLSEADQEAIRAEAVAGRDALTALYEQGRDAGRLKPMDVEALLLAMPGSTTWLTKGLITPDAARKRQIAAEIADLMARGLRPLGG